MNKLIKVIGALALISGAMPSAALADYSRGGGMQNTKCFTKVYREEYIPGTDKTNPGRVRSWYERKEIPCAPTVPRTDAPPRVDDNSCIEGSVIGGITGGALGGTLATKKNWIWSIPAGVVSGALIGCQVDGG